MSVNTFSSPALLSASALNMCITPVTTSEPVTYARRAFSLIVPGDGAESLDRWFENGRATKGEKLAVVRLEVQIVYEARLKIQIFLNADDRFRHRHDQRMGLIGSISTPRVGRSSSPASLIRGVDVDELPFELGPPHEIQQLSSEHCASIHGLQRHCDGVEVLIAYVVSDDL